MMSSKKDINVTKIIEELKRGKTLSEISRELLNTNSTAMINRIINRTGLDVGKYSERYLYMNEAWLKSQLDVYKTPSAIANKFDMPRASVSRYAERYGLYSPKFTRFAKNKLDEKFFDSINTSRKAYWLGFIMADGNIYHYKDSDKCSMEIKIEQSDGYLLREFAKDIGFPVEKVKDGCAMRNGTMCYYTSIRTYNKNFIKSLEKHGISDKKSGNETFPTTIPCDFKRDFIRGYCDGDGSIKEKRIFICSPSFSIISSLSKWFCFSDIAFTLEGVPGNNGVLVYLLKISKRSWMPFANIVYYKGCFGLKRKIDMIKNIQSTILQDSE